MEYHFLLHDYALIQDALRLDAIRFVHFVGLALGLGLAFYADFRVIRHFGAPLKQSDVDFIHMIHRPLIVALLILWASGLTILVIKTGLDPALISAKLAAKLLVVAILTANAWALAYHVLPVLREAVGEPLWMLPLPQFSKVLIFGSISATSWALALGLGVFGIAKTLPPELLFGLIGLVYSSALLGAGTIVFGAMIAMHLPNMRQLALRPL